MKWAVVVERRTRETIWVEARTQPEACEKATDQAAISTPGADRYDAVSWKEVEQ